MNVQMCMVGGRPKWTIVDSAPAPLLENDHFSQLPNELLISVGLMTQDIPHHSLDPREIREGIFSILQLSMVNRRFHIVFNELFWKTTIFTAVQVELEPPASESVQSNASNAIGDFTAMMARIGPASTIDFFESLPEEEKKLLAKSTVDPARRLWYCSPIPNGEQTKELMDNCATTKALTFRQYGKISRLELFVHDLDFLSSSDGYLHFASKSGAFATVRPVQEIDRDFLVRRRFASLQSLTIHCCRNGTIGGIPFSRTITDAYLPSKIHIRYLLDNILRNAPKLEKFEVVRHEIPVQEAWQQFGGARGRRLQEVPVHVMDMRAEAESRDSRYVVMPYARICDLVREHDGYLRSIMSELIARSDTSGFGDHFENMIPADLLKLL